MYPLLRSLPRLTLYTSSANTQRSPCDRTGRSRTRIYESTVIRILIARAPCTRLDRCPSEEGSGFRRLSVFRRNTYRSKREVRRKIGPPRTSRGVRSNGRGADLVEPERRVRHDRATWSRRGSLDRLLQASRRSWVPDGVGKYAVRALSMLFIARKMGEIPSSCMMPEGDLPSPAP